MTQAERRVFLIRYLLAERQETAEIPMAAEKQRLLLRGLMNVRPPREIGADFLTVQNEYLRTEREAAGITDADTLTPLRPGLYLWQGDITTLRCDAIVNAANSGMTGCYVPNHRCIDNAIHTFAGVDYFVLTTNVDHCFQKAGIDKKRLFYTQGDYGLFQCGAPCCPKAYDNEARIRQMVEETANMRIPSGRIPVCPCCGSPMIMNLRCDDRFVEDEGRHRAAERYANFLHTHRGGRTLYLELGVGFNTPGIIKYPFWQRVAQDPNAVYVCINAQEAVCPQDIAPRALCIRTDIAACLETLCG